MSCWWRPTRSRPNSENCQHAGSVAGDFFDAILTGGEATVRAEELLTATKVALLAQSTVNSGEWQAWEAIR